MSSAEDLTNGGSVDWRGVVTAVLGTWVTAMVLYSIELVQLAGSAAEWILVGAVGWYADVIAAVYGVPGSVLDSAWTSAAEFVGTLGVFGLPVAVAVTFAAMWVLWFTFEQTVGGGS